LINGGRKMKNSKLVIISILLLSLVTAAYSGGKGEAGEKEEIGKVAVIRYWTTETDPISVETDFSIIRSYEEQNPNVRVKAEYVAAADIWPKLMASKKAGTEPEMVYASPWQTQTLMGQGWVKPLTKVVDRIGRDKFIQNMLNSFKGQDDEYYGIPTQTAVLQLFYRDDIFKNKGLQPPTYSSELFTLLKKLTEDTNGDGKIDVWGYSQAGQGFMNQSTFVSELWRQGGYMYDEDNNVAFDSKYFQEAVDGLKYMGELAKYCPPGMTGHGYFEMGMNYVNEKTATIRYSGRLISHIERHNPEVGFKTKAVLCPVHEDKKIKVSWCGSDTWVMFNGCKYPEAGMDFLHHYMTGEQYALFLRAVPLHMFPSHSLDEFINKLSEYPEFKKYDQVWKNQLAMMSDPEVPHALNAEHEGVINPYIGEAFGSDTIDKEVAKYFGGEQSAEQAVKNIGTAWRRITEDLRERGVQ
jgi:ABC-type glycerol-3-phosphate transport system substrate-binding protein